MSTAGDGGGGGAGGAGERCRLSELPDDALIRILSSLPSAEAARTSVLSSRFRSLFPRLPSLRFRQSDFLSYSSESRSIACYSQRVLLALLAHSSGSPVESFHLSARFLTSTDRLFLICVDQCIRFALRSGATRIHLDLIECDLSRHPRFIPRLSDRSRAADLGRNVDGDSSCEDEDDVKSVDDTECLLSFFGEPPGSSVSEESEEESDDYSEEDDDGWNEPAWLTMKLSGGLFNNRLLEVLNLKGCRLSQFPRVVAFDSLKSLVLNAVCIEDTDLQRLLDGCPVLENLEMQRCRTDSNLRIASCPRLRRFILLCCHNISCLYVDALQLMEFEYQGGLFYEDMFVMVGAPNLASARIAFCDINDYISFLPEFLGNFKHTKSLRLSSKCLEDFTLDRSSEDFAPLLLPGVKHLELKGEIFNLQAVQAVMDMVDSSPNLESLSLRFTDLDYPQCNVLFEDPEKGLHSGLHYECLKHHLKKLRVQPYGNKLVLAMLKILLTKALVLEEITVVGFKSTYSRHMRIKRKLETFLANPAAKIIYF